MQRGVEYVVCKTKGQTIIGEIDGAPLDRCIDSFEAGWDAMWLKTILTRKYASILFFIIADIILVQTQRRSGPDRYVLGGRRRSPGEFGAFFPPNVILECLHDSQLFSQNKLRMVNPSYGRWYIQFLQSTNCLARQGNFLLFIVRSPQYARDCLIRYVNGCSQWVRMRLLLSL